MIRVIIADDEAKVCTLIQNLVDWSQFDMEIVGVAHNGLEALELIERESPDIIVTDIRMPGCDGLELIEKAKKINANLEFVIISGHRQFEYAQSAIKYGVSDYLLKPLKREELQSTLRKMQSNYHVRSQKLSSEERFRMQHRMDSSKLRSAFMTELVLGEKPPEIPLDEVNSHYHFEFRPGAFLAFLVKIDSSAGINREEISVLYDKVIGIFQRAKQVCAEMEFLLSDSRIYGVLNYEPKRENELERVMKVIMDNLTIQKSAFEGLEFSICLGSAKEDIADLRQSVEESKISLGQRLVSFSGRIITFDNITRLAEYDYALLSDFGRGASVALELLDVQKMRETNQEFSQKMQQIDQISGKAVFDGVIEAYQRFCFLLKNMQLDEKVDDLLLDFAFEADLCSDVKLLFGLLEKRTAAVINRLRDARESEDQKPIRIAKEYIMNNYMNPITLEQVSGLVGFNSSYFSTFFKKKCGMGFLEYLSDIRIGKAKELLRETDSPVSEICEKVGYYDIKHFSKTFKKITGVNPAEFRKLYS